MRVIGLFIVLASLTLAQRAEAQAWIRDPGSVYGQLSYQIIASKRNYDANGDIVDAQSYQQHTLGLYGEIGVVDRWLMLTVNAELLRHGVFSGEGSVTGFGDINLGAWTGLIEKPFRLALGVNLGLPTGNPAPIASGALSQALADLIPTGDGEFDLGTKLAAGHGFGWLRVQQYVVAELGYVLRTTPRSAPGGLPPTDVRNQIVWRAETGIRIDRRFIERFWFVIRVAGLHTAQRRDELSRSSGYSGLGDGVEYVSLGLQASVRVVKGLNFIVGADGAFFARSVPAAPSFRLAISYEHNPK